MEDKQYKRRDRSVTSETIQKTSSLKNYNATYPRGRASDGSEWNKIPLKQVEGL